MTKPLNNILAAVGNTPIIKINKLAPEGVNIYVKAEGFNPMGSVKDRMAVSTIEAAEASGQLKPGQTVIEATVVIPVLVWRWYVPSRDIHWW